jgi:proteasome accessory factor B
VSGADDATERVLNLAAFLRSRRTPATFEEIVSSVRGYDDGAARPTLLKRFKRDAEALRRSGVDVAYDRVGMGYVAPKDGGFFGGAKFSGPETAVLMAIGAAGEAALCKGPLLEALRSAVRKLAPFAAPELDSEPPKIGRLRRAVDHEAQAESLAAAAEACASRRKLRFSYRGVRDAAPRSRDVSIFSVVREPSDWTLIGFDHSVGAERSFKLSRIRGAPRVLKGERAAKRRAADGATTDGDAARVRPTTEVVVRAEKGGAAALDELATFVGASVDAAAATLRFSAEASVVRAVIGRALASGGRLVVTGDAATRAEAARVARALLRAHEPKTSTSGARTTATSKKARRA